MEVDPRLAPVDPRDPAWAVWANPPGRPVFTVDDEHSVVVLPAVVFGTTKGEVTSYFAISPDSDWTLFYQEVYRPTRYELLAGV